MISVPATAVILSTFLQKLKRCCYSVPQIVHSVDVSLGCFKEIFRGVAIGLLVVNGFGVFFSGVLGVSQKGDASRTSSQDCKLVVYPVVIRLGRETPVGFGCWVFCLIFAERERRVCCGDPSSKAEVLI